jgi:hypothetical protein
MDTDPSLAADVLAAKTEELRAKLVAFVLREIKAGGGGPLPEQISAPLLKAVSAGVQASVAAEVARLGETYQAAIERAGAAASGAEASYRDFNAEFQELRTVVERAAAAGVRAPAPEAIQLEAIELKLDGLQAQIGALAKARATQRRREDESAAAPAPAIGVLGFLEQPLLRQVLGVAIITWAVVMLAGAVAAILILVQGPRAASPPAVALVAAGQVKDAARGASAAADLLSHVQLQRATAPDPALADALAKAAQSGAGLETALTTAWAAASGSSDPKLVALEAKFQTIRAEAQGADRTIADAAAEQQDPLRRALADRAHAPAELARALNQAAADASVGADLLGEAAQAELPPPKAAS